MMADNDKMKWFAEDNDSRYSLESTEDGVEAHRDDLDCGAIHCVEMQGDPCG